MTRTIVAASAAEGVQRIEMLGLVPIDELAEERSAPPRLKRAWFNRPQPEDVTTFTRDLALLLRAGIRINVALELLAGETDIGALRPIVADMHSAVIGGESLSEALARHPTLFPSMYLALVSVGEASGTLEHVLELLGDERTRAEELRRRVIEAIRYPLFVLAAAVCVLAFFLMFVLPQFASVLRDFGAKLDPVAIAFIRLSDFLNSNSNALAVAMIVVLALSWFLLRRPKMRELVMRGFSKLPYVRGVMRSHRTALFCRNLSVLLSSGVSLTSTLRILVNIMAAVGHGSAWTAAADQIRHGAKFSDALTGTGVLPAMAVRMLRLGDETGQLPALAGRVADIYEAKLQRSLDRAVAIAGPAAIIIISLVVGGLIVSVMTALLSVSQLVG